MRRTKKIAVLVLVASAGLYQLQLGAQVPTPGLDHQVQVMLIRNTLTALNHGNLTGNYTVLRDLASEPFRRRHNAGDLAATFGGLRRQKYDLSPILVTQPQLTQPPVEVSPGRLQLVGFFPTRPRRVQFGLIFRRVEVGWMIDEIAVQVTAPEPRAEASAAGATAAGWRYQEHYHAAQRDRALAPRR
jgi:hypothetical protein